MASELPQLDIERLTADQKLELIGRLWDSIPLDALPLPDWHYAELERRLESADTAPDEAVPWERVRTRLKES